MNAVISETIKVTKLGVGKQILEIPALRNFVSAKCYAHSKPKTRL